MKSVTFLIRKNMKRPILINVLIHTSRQVPAFWVRACTDNQVPVHPPLRLFLRVYSLLSLRMTARRP